MSIKGDNEVINKLGIYCRVSSKKQMDNSSLENQKERGIKYCEENGYQYSVFKDVVSGDKVNRDGLDELFQKIYDRELDGIVLYRWDRLQRENRELLTDFETLVKDTNCKIIVDNSVRDIIGSLSDRMEYEISNTFSTVERMRLKLRVGEGIERQMERGNTLFGKLKFGYRNEGKKSLLHTVMDEDESPIVKEIFRVFNFKSTKSFDDCRIIINKKFNSEFKLKFIINCLKYDGYKGETYQKWGKPISKSYKITIPQIISDEVWDITQTKVNQIQNLRKGRDREYHLLKGIIYCKDCDDRLYKYGKQPINSEYIQSWYRCKWNIKPQYEKNRILWENGMKCKGYKGNYISRKLLEIIVWDSLLQTLKQSSVIKKKYVNKYKDDLRLKDSSKSSKKYYEIKIEKENDKKFQLYDDYLEKKITKKDYDLYTKRYDDLIIQHSQRIGEIEKKIDTFNNMDSVDFKKIEDLMNSDLERQFDVKNNKDKRRLIDKYIDKIYLKRVDNDNYYINFDLKISEKIKDIPFDKTYIKNRVLYHSDSYICLLRLNVKIIFNVIRVKKNKHTYLFKYNILKYNFDVI